jgi:uncharacterized protein (DUF2141 family)
VTGLTTNDGIVMCTLYDSEATWLKDPGYVATANATPRAGGARCDFGAIPAGTYAISFMHDENGNGDMDSNFLGIPKEPWGMSNDAPARLGPPSFADASFAHPAPAPLTARAR